VETKYVTELLMAELRCKKERQLHATSRNTDFYDPDLVVLESVIDKVDEHRRTCEQACELHESPGGTE
jgi:hypothetical protein